MPKRDAHPDSDVFNEPPDAHDDGSLADEIFGVTVADAIEDAVHAAQLRAIDQQLAGLEGQHRRTRRRVIPRRRSNPA